MDNQKLKVVLDTRNQGKIAELRELLSTVRPDLEVTGLDSYPDIPEIPESGTTFQENALIKARTVAMITGEIAVADDSGLAVPALDGEPGVYSARYAGDNATDRDNNRKLLQRMQHVQGRDRTARFICVLCAYAPNGHRLEVRGEWQGLILDEPRGEGGFGYDPLFYDPEQNLTAAEMDGDLKNSLSHRGQALKILMQRWEDFISEINIQGA